MLRWNQKVGSVPVLTIFGLLVVFSCRHVKHDGQGNVLVRHRFCKKRDSLHNLVQLLLGRKIVFTTCSMIFILHVSLRLWLICSAHIQRVTLKHWGARVRQVLLYQVAGAEYIPRPIWVGHCTWALESAKVYWMQFEGRGHWPLVNLACGKIPSFSWIAKPCTVLVIGD